jgi:signal transduction histidine kinase
MVSVTVAEGKIKQLMKEALIEALQEQRGVFHDLIIEAIEDIALTNAIRQGVGTNSVSRNEVFDILEDQA